MEYIKIETVLNFLDSLGLDSLGYVPFINKNISKLSEKEIQNMIKDISSKLEKYNNDIQKVDEEIIEYKSSLIKTDEYIDRQNPDIEIKKDEVNLKRNELRWNILSAISNKIILAFSKIGSFIVMISSSFISYLLGAIKVIFENQVIVGAIIFVIFILIILAYVFGVIFPLGRNNVNTTNNLRDNDKLAERKLEYNQDLPILTKIYNIFSKIFYNIKNGINTFQARISYNIENGANKKRDEYKDGRWDNIYNMELGKVSSFDNLKENMIYSIKKPTDIPYNVNIPSNTDLNKLPDILKENIINSNLNLKLEWNKEGNPDGLIKYKLGCNPKDNNGNILDLYREGKGKCIRNKILFQNENTFPQKNTPYTYNINVSRHIYPISLDSFIN